MKTASTLRLFIASLTMTAIACSDPMEDSAIFNTTGGAKIQSNHGEYHTSVTTWVRGSDGVFMGLVTQTPNTDLTEVNVYVVKDNKRIWVYGHPMRSSDVHETNGAQGEFFSVSVRNNVLLLNYVGWTAASPPSPLEVIIVY